MKRLLTLVAWLLSLNLAAQNAIVGTGFTSGWGGGSCPTGNSGFEYFTASAGDSYIGTQNGNGTGDQYFRIGVDWGSTTGQHTFTPGSDVAVSENTEYTLNSSCTTSGAMFTNVSSTSHNYVFKTKDAGSSPSFRLIFFKIQGAVQSISAVTQSPATVSVNQAVTVTATLGSAFSTGQSAYLRYSTDNFSTSTIVEMSGSGTTYTAAIPGTANTINTTVRYYCFTSGNGLATNIANDEADWYTINLDNNGGSNYAYTVSSYGNVAAGGACNGFWNDPDCWLTGAVPADNASVNILEDLTMNVSPTITHLTIQTGKVLTVSSNQTLTLGNGGNFTCNGSFAPANGTVAFIGSSNHTVSGTVTFNHVGITGAGVDFGSASTLDGTLTLNSAGFVNSGAPTYSGGSALKYNAGGVYSRRSEWDLKTPHHVQVSNNTQLDMGANGGTGTARTLNGDLTVDNGSAFYMDYSTNDMTQPVTVNGSIQNNGTISLSNAVGGDLAVKGDFAQNGSFNGNSREVTFSGSSTQSISGNFSGGSRFNYLRINGGGVTLGTNIEIQNRLAMNAGRLILNGSTATLYAGATLVDGSGGSTFSVSNMIVADGGGALTRKFSSPGSYTFPVGDATGSLEYSPVVLAINSLSGSEPTINVALTNAINGNFTSTPADYILRYWTITASGITAINYNLTCQYTDGDVVGTEANLYGGKYDAGSWTILNAVNTTDNTLSGSSLTGFSEFTAANMAALPVELLDFKAIADDSQVLLLWKTTTETGNDRFEIERSADASDWQMIGKVAGNGTTLEPQTYSFPDYFPLKGLNYYRLRQVDMDGGFAYSNMVFLEFEAVAANRLTPNPASDFLFLQRKEKAEPGVARFYNLQGQLIKEHQLENLEENTPLDISDLPKGLILFRFFHKTGQVIFIERLIKT